MQKPTGRLVIEQNFVYWRSVYRKAITSSPHWPETISARVPIDFRARKSFSTAPITICACFGELWISDRRECSTLLSRRDYWVGANLATQRWSRSILGFG